VSKARLAFVTIAIVLGTTAPAAAESSAEVRDLARRAQSDPSALARLRQVRDVDGRPVDMERALGEAGGEDLRSRLRTIESGVDAGNAEPDVPLLNNGPQREAARILDSSKYKPNEPPRPLRGVIRRVGDWLEPVLDPIGRVLKPIGRFFKTVFGEAWMLGLLAGLVVLLVAVFSTRMAARRNRAAQAALGGTARAHIASLDPRDLDKEADAAEAAGDFERAFRLRFLAGVLRLDKAGAIDYRQSATTGQLVREVKSSTFSGLARSFDEIAYGGRGAQREDVAQAKADWPRVLQEAGK
jgi:Domain of unknown function (DUF4129)